MFALRVFQKSGAFKKERYGDDLHNLIHVCDTMA